MFVHSVINPHFDRSLLSVPTQYPDLIISCRKLHDIPMSLKAHLIPAVYKICIVRIQDVILQRILDRRRTQ